MKLHIHSANGFASEERESLERLVRLGLTRFVTQVRQVSVNFTDQNGPRGGVDQRCVLRVVLKGLPEILVEETHETVQQAVSFAVARAARSVARAFERRHRNREYQQRRLDERSPQTHTNLAK